MALVCRLDALGTAERGRHGDLLGELRAAVTERRELPDGLALRLAADVPLARVAEWIALERRCCPFLHFRLDVDGDAGPAWLRLTGPDGIRELLVAALSQPPAPA